MLENEAATGIDDEIVDTQEVESAPEPISMDDTIRNTLRGIQDRGDAPADVVAPESPEQKAERIRDRQGKFARPDPNAAAPVEGVPVEQAPVIKAAPNTWRKEAQAEWGKMSPIQQDEVLRREQDFFRGIEQYKGKAQFADRMEKAITPHIDTLQSMGVNPDVAVSELLMADRKLRYGSPAEKQQYFAYLAQSYGIDPTTIQAQQNVQIDPNVQHLENQVRQLMGREQQRELLSQKQEEIALTGEISKFASNPTNRHFESVRGDMAALLQAGIAKDLQDAYERAIYANPQTRAAVLAEQQAAARAVAAKKAQEARRSGAINLPRRPSMPASQPIGTMDETIRSTLRRLQGS
jgi:hypothetical protein